MKIFVVSLKDSPRREAIQNQMDKLGIDFEFFDAVDGRNGVPKEYEHLIDYKAIRKNMSRDITSGEIGCALSHKFLYDKIVEDEIEHTVILEDDVIVDEDFKEVLSARVLEKDKSEFIFLYACYVNIIYSSKQSFWKNYVSYRLFSCCSTVAYYVNLAAAKALKRPIIRSVADKWSIIFLKKSKILYPRLITHPTEEQTTLVGRDETKKYNMLKKVLYKIKYLVFKEGIVAWKPFLNRKDIRSMYKNIDGKY